ncbi:MAG: DUF3029 family protein [Clostridia bacterium]|nr:DUF3029 family protein [Clostridia bacterium]
MYYDTHLYISNKYFEELEHLSAPIRESLIFKHYTEDIPVFIKPDDIFAGWYGYENKPVHPTDNSFDYIPVLSDKEREVLHHLNDDLKTSIHFELAHTCVDYGTVIEKGLIYYKDRVEKELEAEPDNEYLLAMRTSIDAASGFAERYADIAKELAQCEKDTEKKAGYTRMYTALCNVPMYPARDFYEAVQCLWLVHTLVPMAEKSWASISIGRVDQYLYPYYKKAVSDGISRDEIVRVLKHLFVLLDSYGDGACAMNIGGMDKDGNDMTNELSELLIDVEKQMQLRAPIFAVRVNDKTPDRIIDSLIDFELFKIGQPTFYGELACRKAVMSRGVKENEAARFSANSCMGLILAGSEIANMWAVKFNTHLPLELALNNGMPFHGELKFELETAPKEISCLEDLLEQYKSYLGELIGMCARLYARIAKEQAENAPDPFLSALTEGCIEKRGDRATVAKYDTVTVETLGLINTCDAIEAICELVFKQKKYTVSELVKAAKNNFDTDGIILKSIRECKKYGMNDADVNSLCRSICGYVSDFCEENSRGNMILVPSLHTIDANVSFGARLYATLDGRKSGEPVNKNADPSNILKKTDHTSHILSAVSIDQTSFSVGQPIDLYFERAWFDTKETRDKIKNLILTYLKLGGLQLQVNSVDIDLLERAHRSPEDYPYVIVRKGGYSVRFNEMREAVREEFIELAKRLEQRV